MLLGRGGITLNSFCFKLYIKDIFLGLVVYIRAKICYILICNLVLLAILTFIWLVSAILYNKYNSRHAAAIKDRQKELFYIYLGPDGPNYPMVGVNQQLN